MKSALSSKVEENEMIVLENLEIVEAKNKRNSKNIRCI